MQSVAPARPHTVPLPAVSYTEYAAPSEFACDDCSSSRGGDPTPCSFDNYFSSMNLEVMRERETCIREALGSSYFDVDKDANIAAGTPNDCWATWNP